MELFSEIYSCYYSVVERILTQAMSSSHGVSQKEVSDIILQYGFEESNLFLLPKLMEGSYDLLQKKENQYYSKIKKKSPMGYPLSTLQKSFIKALLMDTRIGLFFMEEELIRMESLLTDVEPLFHLNDFYYFDQFTDGDLMTDPIYKQHFRQILEALKTRKTLQITYLSKQKNQNTCDYAPYRLQYSTKNSCFRLIAVVLKESKIHCSVTLNIAKIKDITSSQCVYPMEEEIEECFQNSYNMEPVVIMIKEERNALERCMLHFANYEKLTERCETENSKSIKYRCRIFYNKEEETELLIRILSFGPVIEVIGPNSFLRQVKDRVRKQWLLLDSEHS